MQIYHWEATFPRPAIQHCSFSQFAPLPIPPLRLRHELYSNNIDTGLHLHQDFYALYIVQAGQGIHVIDEHPYGIARGDVYLLSPGTMHGYQDYQTLVIDGCYFQPQLFSQQELAALQHLPGFRNLFIHERQSPSHDVQSPFIERRFHLVPERYEILKMLLSELWSEFLSSAPEATLLAHHLFFRMLVSLARWQAERPITEPVQEYHTRALATILHYCETHYAEPLTVPQLASLLALSPSRFTELFSQEMGISPAAYLRRLRLERAQTLLRTTTRSTTAIAHEVGFTDSAQFSRAFRTQFHLTPRAYRAQFTV